MIERPFSGEGNIIHGIEARAPLSLQPTAVPSLFGGPVTRKHILKNMYDEATEPFQQSKSQLMSLMSIRERHKFSYFWSFEVIGFLEGRRLEGTVHVTVEIFVQSRRSRSAVW